MRKQNTIVLPYTPGSLKLTEDQVKALGFTAEQIQAGEIRGDLTTIGPWQLPVTYRALCTSNLWPEDKNGITSSGPVSVFGWRVLSGCRQSGHELEGRVSVNGKRYRGFTSSQLFELPNGKLISVATIHACGVLKG